MLVYDESNYLEHIGTKRHSGRYPWGSGEDPYQHEMGFLANIQELKDKNPGISDTEVAHLMGITTSEFRARRSAASAEARAARDAEILRLYDKGMSKTAIAERLGVNESVVRSSLKTVEKDRITSIHNTVDVLKKRVEEKTFIDVGSGSQTYLGVSETKMKNAVKLLQDEGYEVYTFRVDQLGTQYKTTVKVLCPPGTDYKDMIANRDKIALPAGEYSEDNGVTFLGIKDPTPVDPKRVSINYKDTGGDQRDGVILIRPGVEDVALGAARYAQVRIKVGEDSYLKGMAMYGDPKDFPKGVDLIFNTNKSKAEAPTMEEVLKDLKDDPDNPFGATIKQRTYIDKNGEEKLSAINIVGSLAKPNEEGNWGEWSKSISSQVLSKQPPSLAKKQLDKAYDEKYKEYEEIMSLTNPAVKKHLLAKFANECDGAAAHLEAAGLPRQQWHVILPFPDIPDNQVYAPNYNDGENVVLIRYPHAGRFEIASLTVNNNLPSPNKVIPQAKDAVGINANVAKLLSGADFDGDTVLVIPNNSGAIKVSKPLKDLPNFDPSEMYKAYDGMLEVKKDKSFNKQREMGSVSNLITDMTIAGASPDDIAAAVRHSMVIIDAEKHNLNWRQSAIDNRITELKTKYQGGPRAGASTVVSKASSEVYVPHRRKRVDVDPETGEKIYYDSGQTWTDKEGKEHKLTTKVPRMSRVKDAYELVSDRNNPPRMESIYADYANSMKALALKARKDSVNTPNQVYSPSARKAYAQEVSSLSAKLNTAQKNAPLERKAHILGNIVVAAKRRENPSMDAEQVSRTKAQALSYGRIKTGAIKDRIKITPKEWEAIQAGAVSDTQLKKMLDNTDLSVIKSYATPRAAASLSPSEISKIRSMVASGNYTQAEIASSLGVSVSTINNALKN